MNLKRLLVFSLLIILSTVKAQDYSITWGDEIPKSDRVNNFYNIDGKSFEANTFQPGYRYAMTHVEDLNIYNKTIYTLNVENKNSGFTEEGTYEFNGELLIFTSKDNKEKTEKTLYVHKFKHSANEIDLKGEKVISFSFDRSNKRRASYIILNSENKKNLCIIYSAQSKRNKENGVYGYYILDEKLNIKTQGEFEEIIDNKNYNENIDRFYISNSGKLYCLTTRTEKYVKDSDVSIGLYSISTDEITEVNLHLEDRFVSQLRMEDDEKGNLMVTGFFGKKTTGIKGIFSMLINPDKETIIQSDYYTFSDEFILQGMREKQKEKIQKRNERKGREASLDHFYLRSFKKTSDGGYFGIAEFYQLVIYTSTDQRTGATRTTYHYYYNDLIVFKINNRGELEWNKKIFKYQFSTNDDGYYSSFCHVQMKDKVMIVFNDNAKNYSPETGEFIAKEGQVLQATLGKRNAMAVVEVDLEDGDINRQMLSKNAEKNLNIVPKYSSANEKDNAILLFANLGKRQKIGYVKF